MESSEVDLDLCDMYLQKKKIILFIINRATWQKDVYLYINICK
jgi:hypothetical protein